jgi:hypothetical protein
MENNEDETEREFNAYGRDLNGRYIIRKRDKCILGVTFIVSIYVILYNVYLLNRFFI